MSTVVKDLGAVSAYAYAVEKGYTGTEAEFAELMADYAEVGQRAEDAADSALESKTAAQTAATTATTKASEATTAATTATNKAAEAQADADAAALDASQAMSAASTATTKATEATTAAATATSAATTATTAKDDAVSAKTAAQTAQAGAETAAASVQSSAAQIATNTSDINELKEDINRISELEVTWITGKYIWKEGGVEVNGASYKCTDFIPINEIRKPFVYRLRVFNNMATYALYDSNKRYIPYSAKVVSSSSLIIDEDVFVPTTANAAYIRFSTEYQGGYSVYVKTGNINDISIGNRAITNAVLGLKAVELGNVGDSVIVHDEQTNFIDMDAITSGKYINANGGTNNSNDYYITDYIPMEAEADYYQSNVLFTYYAFYDENKNFIASYNTLGNLGRHFVTPSNTAFGRFSLNSNQFASNPWISIYNAKPNPYKLKINNTNLNSYAVSNGTNVENPCDYDGKEISLFNKICCIGDSITIGTFNHNEGGTEQYLVDTKYSYPTFLKKMFGVETVNWGLGGYTSVQWWNAKQNEDFSGFDCAIINLGINDALNSVSISDTETAFRSIINALKTANNNIKIFLATIVPAYADGVTTFDAVNELIEDLAEELTNCYLVDLSQYSHVSKGSAYEAGHLTAIGYRMLAQDYAGYIGYIIRTNLAAFKWVQFIGTNYSRT